MPIRCAPLDDDAAVELAGWLAHEPYRDAIPLSNVTTLRHACRVVVAWRGDRPLGMVSSYDELPVPNLTFATRDDQALAPLLAASLQRWPELIGGPIWTLLPAGRHAALCRQLRLVAGEAEHQMVITPARLADHGATMAQPLDQRHAGALQRLADAAALTGWHWRALTYGPCVGHTVDDAVVAMAATRFQTAVASEIGHVATHPDFRRQGRGADCTIAITRAAMRPGHHPDLMCRAGNPALALYRRLGFTTLDTFQLARFAVH